MGSQDCSHGNVKTHMLIVSLKVQGLGLCPPLVDRIWLWVYYHKIPIYPIFYLLKGDHKSLGFGVQGSGFLCGVLSDPVVTFFSCSDLMVSPKPEPSHGSFVETR